MKTQIIALIITLTSSIAFAQNSENTEDIPERRGPPPRHLELTDEQKECLESKIGSPEEGVRPSREAMTAAFDACGIEKPEHPPRRRERTQSSN